MLKQEILFAASKMKPVVCHKADEGLGYIVYRETVEKDGIAIELKCYFFLIMAYSAGLSHCSESYMYSKKIYTINI